MTPEIRPIPSTFGLYGAGVDGRIYRIDSDPPRPLRAAEAGSSVKYQYVGVCVGGRPRSVAVHRLVCEAFYGPCPDWAQEVRHLDGDPTNNNPLNLDWGTISQNRMDAVSHGSIAKNRRLSAQDADAIRTSSQSDRALGRIYGVSGTLILKIRRGDAYAPDLPHQPPPNMPRFVPAAVVAVEDMPPFVDFRPDEQPAYPRKRAASPVSPCDVSGCGAAARKEGLCPHHLLFWTASRGSDKTPGREDRLRAYIARASARNFPEAAPIIRQEGSP